MSQDDGFHFDDDEMEQDALGDGETDSTSVQASPYVEEEPMDYEQETERPRKHKSKARPIARQEKSRFYPKQPKTVLECGLSQSYMEELILKHLFQAGELRGSQLNTRTGLTAGIVEELLTRLRKSQFVEVKGSSGAGVGHSGMIFNITEAGISFVQHSLDRDRYVGVAPVTYDQYLQGVRQQTIRGNLLTRDDIRPHFKDLVLRDEVFDSIGPAMNSGKALFFYGPPGNGKTAICQRMTNCFGGDIYIPHAVIVDDFIIKVFDETLHHPIEDEGSIGGDRRWVRCRRPMVVVGGELMLEDLDLSYSSEVKYYEAPFQMKANNGMLLVDDFGRQKVSPKDLLNRWIVPLESEVDYLAMHTGKKLQVPFDVFVTFSTNLDPESLVDGAFLRRVRYKLEVSRPTPKAFARIFQRECKRRSIEWDSQLFAYLLRNHYQSRNRPLNACEPRDLLDQVVDLCAYHGSEPFLAEEIIDRVVDNYFVHFGKEI
ncbi:MAG: ATPase [Deltaproteobacteria bacterium]|nr:ATPase [Deltaproteobacteria bacterium]